MQTGDMVEVVPSTNGLQSGDGPGHAFWDGSGKYCVIAWSYDQSTSVYSNLGEPCENVT